MTKTEFVKKYYPDAARIGEMFFMPATAVLAQAAHESAWGKSAPGYNFFGMTASGSWKGKRQLLKTTEYHSTRNVRYPVIISIAYSSAMKAYKYIVRRYFRLYSDALFCFYDYAWNLATNDRYARAFSYQDDAVNFLTEIAKAGYATDPQYLNKILAVHNSILKELEYIENNQA